MVCFVHVSRNKPISPSASESGVHSKTNDILAVVTFDTKKYRYCEESILQNTEHKVIDVPFPPRTPLSYKRLVKRQNKFGLSRWDSRCLLDLKAGVNSLMWSGRADSYSTLTPRVTNSKHSNHIYIVAQLDLGSQKLRTLIKCILEKNWFDDLV